MKTIARSVCLLAAGWISTQAAVVVSNVTNAPDGLNFRWTYTFSVQPDQIMRQTCTGTCSLVNDFGILYDFPGYVPGSATVEDIVGRTFTLTEQATGTNPPFQGPPDSGVLPNFIVALTGGGNITPAGGTAVEAFRLVLLSTLGPDPSSPNLLFFGGQALTTATQLTAGNTGQILGPGTAPPDGEVPEPTAMSLLGGGLAAFGLLRLRRPRA